MLGFLYQDSVVGIIWHLLCFWFCFFLLNRFRREKAQELLKTLALNWKITSPPFEMCDLVKIQCGGGVYTLNLGSTKEAILRRLQATGGNTLDSHVAILMIPLTLQVSE